MDTKIKFNKPSVVFENSDVEISDKLRERSGKPVTNRRTVVNLGKTIDDYMEDSMKMSQDNRRNSLELFLK